MKNTINKKMTEKKVMSYLQMFILITASFAFAYIIYENTVPLGEMITQIEEINPPKQKNNLFKVLGLFILEKIKQPLLPMVSANTGDYCCERTNAGVWCENTAQENCDSDPIYNQGPFTCDSQDWCNQGCCYDPSEGICMDGTYGDSCAGGDWTEGSCGDILDCKQACCIFGGQSAWMTEIECETTAANHPGRTWDTNIANEVQCILLSETQGVGACIQDLGNEKVCRFIPEAECLGPDVEFRENDLCTDPDLNTTCVPSEDTMCVDGKHEVYFQDSCGNIANIYDASKLNDIGYWTTKVTKNNSCGYGDLTGNADSQTCGNCKYIDGSTCGLKEDITPTYGENICKDLSCENVEIDGQEVTKQNGESWCAFDGAIGVGDVNGNDLARDVVGSRYWRHHCLDGEERVEPCAPFRNEVCSEDIDEQTGRSFAVCRINRWRDCINREVDVCEENSDCWKKHIGIDDFQFDVCLPKYPGGFDIFEADANRNGQTICGVATQSCHVVYVKSWAGGSCKCESNCGCEDVIFEQQMNSLCVSLGDCGGYVNIEGKYTNEGYGITKKGQSISKRIPASDITKMAAFANALLFPGQFVGAGAFIQAPSYFSGIGPTGGEGGEPGWSFNIVSGVAIGVIALQIAVTISMILTATGPLAWNPIGLMIAAIMIALAYIFGMGEVCKEFDVTYTCMSWQPPVGGDDCEKCNGNEQKPCTTYRCESLGKACEFINEGTTNEQCVASIDDQQPPIITPLFKNVTEGLVYENEQANGFEIRNTNSNDGCVEAFTPMSFSIKTSEHAVCKYDLVRETSFSEMPQYFGGSNLLLKNHTNTMILPSPQSLADFYQVPTENILEAYGNLELFVECQDKYGDINPIDYSIKFCVKQGPDLTAPYIVTSEPLDIAYLKYGETDKTPNIWASEPVDCKYTEIDDTITYDNMENNMSCEILLTDYTVRGWPCEFTLDNITTNKDVFIRCKDQPWLPDWNLSRNVNQQSTKYMFRISPSELEIEEMRPEDEEKLISGIEPWSLELRLKTKGGAQQGRAICKWREDYQGWHTDSFAETDSIYHKSSEFSLTKGGYSFDYTCEDIAGNMVEDSSSFELEIDDTGPRVTRIYFDNGLKVITNGKAECRYSFKRSTPWTNSTVMGGNDFEHIASWQLRTYYVQCEDEYHNKGVKKRIRAYTLLD